MIPRVSLAALAAALLCSTTAVADVDLYHNAKDFEELTKAHDGTPQQTFRSSDIIAPVFQVNTLDVDGIDGASHIFMATVFGEGGKKSGPMIFDARDLSLVYADQNYDNAFTSNVHTINGTRYLYFWQGERRHGHAPGQLLFFDENYNLAYEVTAVGDHINGADAHEAFITADQTAVFTTYYIIDADLTSVGGKPKAPLYECGFQEVDLNTNELLFEWNFSEHFPVNSSYVNYTEVSHGGEWAYDFAHINAVQKGEDGNYLVSSRHLSQLALIDGTTGEPIWVLGGKHNQFEDLSDGRATSFGWQHSARFYDNQSHIIMFDNHAKETGTCGSPEADYEECLTRVLHVEIDTKNMTVREVHSYYHPQHINAGAMGGSIVLEGGNILSGWGYSPGYVEYKPDGTVVMDVQRGELRRQKAYLNAYRVFKGDWQGMPKWPPSIAVDAPEDSSHDGVVYLSWNGASEVASWIVVAADDPFDLSDPHGQIAQSNRTGFETTIPLGTDHTARRYVAGAAVDKDGNILGSTLVMDMHSGSPAIMKSKIDEVHAPPPPQHEPEPESDSKAESESESEDDSDHDDHDHDVDLTSAIIVGSSILVFAASFAIIAYAWRRWQRTPDIEQTLYEKVEGGSADEELETPVYDDKSKH